MSQVEVVYNPFEPGFSENPYTQYEELRTADPVHHSPLGGWVLVQYDDVLRLLRYYRFEARFGGGTGDKAARAACRAAAPLLPKLSAERVASELLRLLAVPNPVPALRMMAEDGVLAAILPEAQRLDRLERLVGLEPECDPLRRLAALVETDAAGAEAVAERLRLSNAERDRLIGLAQPRPLVPADDFRTQRLALYRFGGERYRDLVLLLAAEGATDNQRWAELLDLAARWKPPRFPLKGRDVTGLGIAPGPRVGQLLAEVQQWWVDGDFAADRAACLAKLAEIAKAEA